MGDNNDNRLLYTRKKGLQKLTLKAKVILAISSAAVIIITVFLIPIVAGLITNITQDHIDPHLPPVSPGIQIWDVSRDPQCIVDGTTRAALLNQTIPYSFYCDIYNADDNMMIIQSVSLVVEGYGTPKSVEIMPYGGGFGDTGDYFHYYSEVKPVTNTYSAVYIGYGDEYGKLIEATNMWVSFDPPIFSEMEDSGFLRVNSKEEEVGFIHVYFSEVGVYSFHIRIDYKQKGTEHTYKTQTMTGYFCGAEDYDNYIMQATA